jgi:hypothetical protein
MYTVPHPRIQVELRVTVDGRQHALRTAGSLRRDVEDYARRKTTLGRWVSDDDFARSLLDRNPTWEAVTLVLHRWRLDRESARWRVRSESIAVRREGASALPSGQAGAM